MNSSFLPENAMVANRFAWSTITLAGVLAGTLDAVAAIVRYSRIILVKQ